MVPRRRRALQRVVALAALGVGALVGPGPAGGAEGQEASPRAVRPLGRDAERLLAEAHHLSPTVRRQLAELDLSDLRVYLKVWHMPSCRTGLLSFLAGAKDVRYLMIEVAITNREDAAIGWLGHELQHAIEVASAGEVRDEVGFRQLFERIGHRHYNPASRFETDAAIKAGNQVLAEVASAPSPLTARRAPR